MRMGKQLLDELFWTLRFQNLLSSPNVLVLG